MKKRRRDERRSGLSRDRHVVAAVCRWFREHARPLPWRLTPRNPYLSLVSEFMLQQTQVSRVLERWPGFVRRFPTLQALAAASRRDVLAAWSGMGYYRRATHLHTAAREITGRFGGRVPGDAPTLRTLPGVGRYTAGAIASMVFGKPEPIVDGNVARVLLRLEGREIAQEEGVRWAWGRAAGLVQISKAARHGRQARQQSKKWSRSSRSREPGGGPAALNEGLMELGAVLCTPRRPRCAECPVSRWCVARELGLAESIPRPKARPVRSDLFCSSVVVEDPLGRVLVEPRGEIGLWAGMWQAPTLERTDRAARRGEVAAWIGAEALSLRERFEHGTTHRRVCFEVWGGRMRRKAVTRPGAAFRSRAAIARLALSNPQRRVLLGTG